MLACQDLEAGFIRFPACDEGGVDVINGRAKRHCPLEYFFGNGPSVFDEPVSLLCSSSRDNMRVLGPAQDILGRFEMIEMMAAAPARFGVGEIQGKIPCHQCQTAGAALRCMIRPAHSVTI